MISYHFLIQKMTKPIVSVLPNVSHFKLSRRPKPNLLRIGHTMPTMMLSEERSLLFSGWLNGLIEMCVHTLFYLHANINVLW